MEYAVKAETEEGKVLVLKRGFASHEKAEDFSIQMSRWKRVWVEPIGEEAGGYQAGEALTNHQP